MATIRPPGAKVTQTSVVATVPVQTPTMPACIIGPCMEIVEARTSSGSANPSALVTVPAVVASTDTAATKALHSLSVRVSVNGGADQEVEFAYSPSDAALTVALVSTTLDEGLTGVVVTNPGNKVTFATVAKGNSASLLFKKAKVRINHGSVLAGTAFVEGNAVVRYSGGVAVSADTIGTVTLVGSGYIIVDTLDSTYALTTGYTGQFGVVSSGTYAASTSTKSAYSVLGMTAFMDVTVDGYSTYQNRSVKIPFLNLPVSKGTQGELAFDDDTMALYRLQGGVLKSFSKTETVLRNRNTVSSTTLQQSRAVVPSSGGYFMHGTDTVTYTSVPGINGSVVNVVHHRTVVVTLAAGYPSFTVGRCVVKDTGTDRFIGRIVAKAGATLTIALYGTAVIGDLGLGVTLLEVHPTSPQTHTTHAATATTALTVPIVEPTATLAPAVESRLLKCTVSSETLFTKGQAAYFASSELIGTDDNPVTSGVVKEKGTGYVVVEATGVAPVTGVVLFTATAAQTVTAITALDTATTVVVYVGVGNFTAQIAHAVNINATAAALVTAHVGGDPAGSSALPNTGGYDGTVNRLSPISVSAGAPALVSMTGYPFDDRDGDTTTPYFWTKGSYASYTHGTGTSALTFEARGGQDMTAQGDYHGAYGNDVTVTLVGTDVTDIAVSGSGGSVVVAFNSASHTANQIAAAINASSTAASVIKATGGGVGVPTSVYAAKLYGGANPVDFQATPDQCLVSGQRPVSHFKLIKCTVASTAGFLVGETLKLTNTSGAVLGVIREINSTAGVLWVDPTIHSGLLAAYTAGTPSVTLDDHAALVTSLYVGWVVSLTSGSGIGLTKAITAYATSKIATLAGTFGTAPSANDTYDIVAAASISASALLYGATSANTATVVSVTQRGVTAGDTLTFRVNGGVEYSTTFTTTALMATVVSAINTTTGYTFAIAANPTSPATVMSLDAAVFGGRSGIESTVELGGSAVEKLFGLEPSGITFAGLHEGIPYKTLVGDEVDNGTTVLGTISRIETLTVGSKSFATSRLRLSSDTLVTTTSYTQWWVKARNIELDADLLPVAVSSIARPMPGVVIDVDNEELRVTQAQARLADGVLSSSVSQGMYIDYDAVREDLSADVLTINSYTALETAMGPVTPENPLAWAMYAAIQNSAGQSVQCIGVDATSDAYPEGTLGAYERALEILETKGVYWLVPLTQDADVHDAVHTHCLLMSMPENKRERRGIYNRATPVEDESTLAGSGSGSLTATNTVLVDSDDMNVVDVLTDAGIESPESLSWADLKEAGVYLRVTSNVSKYSISGISGQTLTLATANFEPGENDDDFYATTSLVDGDLDTTETVSLFVRGAEVSISTAAGRDSIIAAMALQAQHFADSRAILVAPSQFGQNYNSVEQSVSGVYYCAGMAGKFSASHPAQPQSRSTVIGFNRPIGSNDTFKESQLDTAAGGGIWWAVQEAVNGPVTNRHQLTTDVSSIESRELSIVVPGDWIAMAVRSTVRNIPGRENITDQLMSMVALGLEGLSDYVRQKNIAKDLNITSITQSEDAPDTIEIEATRDPLYPCNTISMTIQT